MRDHPDVDNLLATARASLLQDILPAVPRARRLDVLMVANALGIARRSLAAGDAPLRAELLELERLYHLPPSASLEGGALDEMLAALNTRLAEDIRQGVFDEPNEARRAVQDFLWETTLYKLRENKPKMLAAEGLE